MNQIDIEGIKERQHTYAIMASYGCEATKWTAAVQFADYACEVFPALLDAYTEQAAEIAGLKGLVEDATNTLKKLHGYLETAQGATQYVKPNTGVWHTLGVALDLIGEWRGFSEREGG